MHSTSFQVNDAATVKERMMARGATEVVDVDLPFHKVGLGIGPTCLLVMDTREQPACAFEMAEPIEGWTPHPARTELAE